MTTEEAIKILKEDEVIYWTEEGYQEDGVDWETVSKSFPEHEIHSFMQGMKTRVILKEEINKAVNDNL